ncbi:MAG: TauD/TfdA family dioxygenase [Actinomycetota bacterium]
MQITPAGTVLGATVTDVDVRHLTDEQCAELDAAWARHGVLFIRGQELSPPEQLAFATRFAPVDVNRFFAPVDGHPEVAQVLKEPDQAQNIGGAWHTDHSYDRVPARGSVLYAVETPPAGGDTLFADVGAAYETLSPGLQATLAGLRAIHTNVDVFGPAAQSTREMGDRFRNPEAANETTSHPVVIRHPMTGRPLLYVNPGFTRRFDGWTTEESRPLLQQLYAHIADPRFTIRFRWAPGSIAMWDNRSTWHHAVNDYPGQRRLMHRVTIRGEAIEAIEASRAG